MPDNDGVTPRTINADLRELAVQVAEMRGTLGTKIDGFINQTIEMKANMAASRLEHVEQLKGFSHRIDSLAARLDNVETRLNRYAGGLAVLVVLLGLFGQKILAALGG